MLARDIAQRDVTTLNPLHKLESAGIHTVLGDSIQLRGTHMSNSSSLALLSQGEVQLGNQALALAGDIAALLQGIQSSMDMTGL